MIVSRPVNTCAACHHHKAPAGLIFCDACWPTIAAAGLAPKTAPQAQPATALATPEADTRTQVGPTNI